MGCAVTRGAADRRPSCGRGCAARSPSASIVAEQIADDPAARDADRIAALAFLARYGLGTSDELSLDADSPQAWIAAARSELLALIRQLGPEAFARRLHELDNGE